MYWVLGWSGAAPPKGEAVPSEWLFFCPGSGSAGLRCPPRSCSRAARSSWLGHPGCEEWLGVPPGLVFGLSQGRVVREGEAAESQLWGGQVLRAQDYFLAALLYANSTHPLLCLDRPHLRCRILGLPAACRHLAGMTMSDCGGRSAGRALLRQHLLPCISSRLSSPSLAKAGPLGW